MKEIVDKLDFIKIKKPWKSRRMRRQDIDYEKYSQRYKLLKLSNRKTNNPFKKWAKININGHLTKEDLWITNKHMKKCFTSFVTGEMQVKAMRHH